MKAIFRTFFCFCALAILAGTQIACTARQNAQWEFADNLAARGNATIGDYVDINGTNRDGENIFKAMVAADNVEAVKFLIAHRANPFVIDASGISAYEYAAKNRKWRSLELLVPYVKTNEF